MSSKRISLIAATIAATNALGEEYSASKAYSKDTVIEVFNGVNDVVHY